LKATAVGVIFTALISLIFKIEFVTLYFLICLLPVTALAIISGRFFASMLLRRSLGSLDSRPRLLIVGINSRSIRFADGINSMPQHSHKLIGFADDVDIHTAEFDFGKSPYEIVTDIESLPEYLRVTQVDEVLVSLPMKSRYDDASRIVSICEEQGITIKVMADLFQYRMTHSRAEKIGDASVITVAFHGMIGVPALLKRMFDVAVSVVLLTVFAPLFVVVGIVIKLTSPGTVFYLQNRIGLNKKKFKMIKFRTMVVEAEAQQIAIESLNEAAGPVFKIKLDPRITGVGRFLRRFSIDELPQLINVCKGEMSLVGPRPLPLRDYEGFSEDWHRRRVSVPPGLSGLWQVESRDHGSFDEWMKLDMEYIDRWSLWLDLKIVLQTIPAVLRGSGG